MPLGQTNMKIAPGLYYAWLGVTCVFVLFLVFPAGLTVLWCGLQVWRWVHSDISGLTPISNVHRHWQPHWSDSPVVCVAVHVWVCKCMQGLSKTLCTHVCVCVHACAGLGLCIVCVLICFQVWIWQEWISCGYYSVSLACPCCSRSSFHNRW